MRHVSSAIGQRRLLPYMPERSTQHGRRLPLASMSQALVIRRARVSACLAVTIHWIQSRRAAGVMSDHTARALGGAAARALRRGGGTVGSGSALAGAISRVTTSP